MRFMLFTGLALLLQGCSETRKPDPLEVLKEQEKPRQEDPLEAVPAMPEAELRVLLERSSSFPFSISVKHRIYEMQYPRTMEVKSRVEGADEAHTFVSDGCSLQVMVDHVNYLRVRNRLLHDLEKLQKEGISDLQSVEYQPAQKLANKQVIGVRSRFQGKPASRGAMEYGSLYVMELSEDGDRAMMIVRARTLEKLAEAEAVALSLQLAKPAQGLR